MGEGNKSYAFTLSCKSFALTEKRSRHSVPAAHSVRLPGFANAHPSAFTLAETLIALVVIGIVAALTVPTIVAKQREQATVEKVKKFYSTMSNAINRAIVDTGMNIDE